MCIAASLATICEQPLSLLKRISKSCPHHCGDIQKHSALLALTEDILQLCFDHFSRPPWQLSPGACGGRYNPSKTAVARQGSENYSRRFWFTVSLGYIGVISIMFEGHKILTTFERIVRVCRKIKCSSLCHPTSGTARISLLLFLHSRCFTTETELLHRITSTSVECLP